jgi:hypothetical protein
MFRVVSSLDGPRYSFKGGPEHGWYYILDGDACIAQTKSRLAAERIVKALHALEPLEPKS